MRFSAWSSDVCSSDLAHDASSVRATLFIDPDGVLQASTCYPATVGRSVDEMLRTVAALQRVHDGSALATVDWRQGELGNESCRARECQDVYFLLVAV